MFPLGRAYAADTEASLFQHLHIFQRLSRLAYLSELFESDWVDEFTAKLDVHHAPLWIIWFRGRVIVWRFGVVGGN
jgi:hypothetical protein